MEVFAEKMLQACHALLGVVAELKRNALLNDVAGRNAEVGGRNAGLPSRSRWHSTPGQSHSQLLCVKHAQVAASSAEADTEAAALQLRFQQLRQRIDAAMQVGYAVSQIASIECCSSIWPRRHSSCCSFYLQRRMTRSRYPLHQQIHNLSPWKCSLTSSIYCL
jgi:hypothetical protein